MAIVSFQIYYNIDKRTQYFETSRKIDKKCRFSWVSSPFPRRGQKFTKYHILICLLSFLSDSRDLTEVTAPKGKHFEAELKALKNFSKKDTPNVALAGGTFELEKIHWNGKSVQEFLFYAIITVYYGQLWGLLIEELPKDLHALRNL